MQRTMLKSKIHRATVTQVHPGDLVIMIAYGQFDDAEARSYVPTVVHVDADNRMIELGTDPGAAVAGMATELVSGSVRR